MKITNEHTGQVIELEETNDIAKLRNQLMLLGMSGLFYSPWAKDIKNWMEKLEKETGK